MERNIEVTISNKKAVAEANARIICNNGDYTVTFLFDDEWDMATKTARFTTSGKYTDVVFTGNTVAVPPLSNARYVLVGVYAGELTSTPAFVSCERSILCDGGKPYIPSEDVYAQIIKMLNDIAENGVTDEQLAFALDRYFEDNPIQGFEVDDSLIYENGKLSVNTTNVIEEDNTLPVTSAAIHTEIGNINVLLETI